MRNFHGGSARQCFLKPFFPFKRTFFIVSAQNFIILHDITLSFGQWQSRIRFDLHSLCHTFCTSLRIKSESSNFFNVIFSIIKLEILWNITPLLPVILLCFCYLCKQWCLATPNLARDSRKVSVSLIAVLFRLSVQYLCLSFHIR